MLSPFLRIVRVHFIKQRCTSILTQSSTSAHAASSTKSIVGRVASCADRVLLLLLYSVTYPTIFLRLPSLLFSFPDLLLTLSTLLSTLSSLLCDLCSYSSVSPFQISAVPFRKSHPRFLLISKSLVSPSYASRT
jgi:hypothetical protein